MIKIINNTSIESHRRFLDKSIAILRFSGVLSYDTSATGHLRIFTIFMRVFSNIIVISYVLTMLADAVVNCNDLMIFVSDGCFIAGWFIAYSKEAAFYRKRHRFLEFIDNTHRPVDVLRQSTDLALLLDVKECMLYEAIDYYLMSLFVIVLGSAIIISSLILGKLPNRAIFPFDTTIPVYYRLAFFIQAYNTVYHLIVLVTIDFISWQLMRYTTLQLRVLSFNYINCKGDSLRPVAPDLTREYIGALKISSVFSIDDQHKEICQFAAFEEREMTNISVNFTERFKTCVKHHLRLIRVVKDFNDTFSFSLMVQLGGSLLIICLNGYMVVMFPGDRDNFIRSTAYLLSGFIQLLYWCAFGNQLKFQADFLTKSQWMSGWENSYDRGIKNLVTTAMIKTMQPLEIRAGGLFVLTMETFLSILKSSYSVFVLLTTATD
ncbi:uncharacterized protein LOC123262122 [Cotesia glomerata]|uniref:uncharacterized protein LOC123262122 n=1 Tax=Cotesia glomerata TaxID=32391 RepID=UPI001D008580|nr:uncharacterized protein LOC123262122 [Cotesia glomerata]XP_044580134.1 uncharacterized protein LOC123262122 [Cotesia glomerata]XP_044580136.1 uncharacterized protein LOC123262122 [Cotesia glomerata]XP_044580137.1 uncharacterized protein LOC123262122 [Cotesia glomerata]